MTASIADMTGSNGAHIILVVNKSDLLTDGRIQELRRDLLPLCSCPILFVSARNGSGIEEIREQLVASVETGRLDNPQYIVTNARHYEALKTCIRKPWESSGRFSRRYPYGPHCHRCKAGHISPGTHHRARHP